MFHYGNCDVRESQTCNRYIRTYTSLSRQSNSLNKPVMCKAATSSSGGGGEVGKTGLFSQGERSPKIWTSLLRIRVKLVVSNLKLPVSGLFSQKEGGARSYGPDVPTVILFLRLLLIVHHNLTIVFLFAVHHYANVYGHMPNNFVSFITN